MLKLRSGVELDSEEVGSISKGAVFEVEARDEPASGLMRARSADGDVSVTNWSPNAAQIQRGIIRRRKTLTAALKQG